MQSSKITQETKILLQHWFDVCLGTKDENNVLDLIITDGYGGLYEDLNTDAPISVGWFEILRLNFVMGNERVRSIVVYSAHWEVFIEMVRKTVAVADREWEDDKDLTKALSAIGNPFHTPFKTKLKPNQSLQFPTVATTVVIDHHSSIILAERPVTEEEEEASAEILGMERYFEEASKILKDAEQRVKANFTTLQLSSNIKRDHNMYFTHFIDFDKREIGVSLSRMLPLKVKVNPDDGRLDKENPDVQTIVPVLLNPDDWKDVFSDEKDLETLKRLTTIFNGFNNFNKRFDKYTNPHTVKHIKEVFSNIWSRLMALSYPVYMMDKYGCKEIAEVAMEALLKEIPRLGENVYLDIVSWYAWDYSDPAEPKLARNFNDYLGDLYREEFIQIMYSYLLSSKSAYLRPYTKRTVITDPELLKQHKVNSTRTQEYTMDDVTKREDLDKAEPFQNPFKPQ